MRRRITNIFDRGSFVIIPVAISRSRVLGVDVGISDRSDFLGVTMAIRRGIELMVLTDNFDWNIFLRITMTVAITRCCGVAISRIIRASILHRCRNRVFMAAIVDRFNWFLVDWCIGSCVNWLHVVLLVNARLTSKFGTRNDVRLAVMSSITVVTSVHIGSLNSSNTHSKQHQASLEHDDKTEYERNSPC